MRSCWRLLVAVSVAGVVALQAQTAAPPATVVFLGDSITRGVRSGVTAEQTFVSLLQAWFAAAGCPIEAVNQGIGGERTDLALARLERDVLARRPRIVLVMYGTNDSAIDAGAAGARLPLETYRQHLAEIVARIQAAGAKPVLMTSIPLCSRFVYMERSPYREKGPNHALVCYIHAARQVAQEQSLPLVDHYAAWAEEALLGADLNRLTTDGCHPNPAGHCLMARTIYPVLARQLGVAPDLPVAALPAEEAAASVPPAAAGVPRNLALHCTYQESCPNPHGYGSGLTDGDRTSDNKPGVYATGAEEAYPKTTTIDLKEACPVGRIVVCNSRDGSTRTVTVATSADGQTFAEVGRHVFAQGDAAVATLRFPPVKARYVRLSFRDTWGNVTHGSPHFMFLREAEVFAQ